jgi:hypothetical protein
MEKLFLRVTNQDGFIVNQNDASNWGQEEAYNRLKDKEALYPFPEYNVSLKKLRFEAGQKITYLGGSGRRDPGKIVRLGEDGKTAFVVYNCSRDWDNYQNYTAARTPLVDLVPGWPEGYREYLEGEEKSLQYVQRQTKKKA